MEVLLFFYYYYLHKFPFLLPPGIKIKWIFDLEQNYSSKFILSFTFLLWRWRQQLSVQFSKRMLKKFLFGWIIYESIKFVFELCGPLDRNIKLKIHTKWAFRKKKKRHKSFMHPSKLYISAALIWKRKAFLSRKRKG